MMLLVALLALNALLHAAVIFRFGLADRYNMPVLIFTFVYAALALAVLFAVPHVLWAVLVLSVFGLIGLSLTFNKPQRADKTVDKAIWATDAAVVLCTIWLLFVT